MDKIKSMLHLGGDKAEEKAEQHGHSTGHHSSSTGHSSTTEDRVPASGGTYNPATSTDPLDSTSSRTHGTSSGLGSSSTDYASTQGQGISSYVPGTSSHREKEYEQGSTGLSGSNYGSSTTTGTPYAADNYGSSTTGTGYGSSTASRVESAISGTSSHREKEYEQGSTGLGSSSNYGSSTTGSGAGYIGGSTGETIASYIPGTEANAASKGTTGTGYGSSSTGAGYESSSTSTGLGSGTHSSGLTGSSLPDRSVGTSGSTSGNFGTTDDVYHRNEILAHHGPHTTLTARILDPATADAPTGIYSAPDPYLTTGGEVSHHTSSTIGLGSSSTGYGSSTTTSDPYSSSSTSRDPNAASNFTTSTTGHSGSGTHSSGHQSTVGGLMDKVTGRSHNDDSSSTSRHQGASGNDSSRDTGLSGFSTGNPNQGGDTRVPTEEFGSSNTGSHGSHGHQGQSTLGRAEDEIDSRVDSSRHGHSSGATGDSSTGGHSIVGGY